MVCPNPKNVPKNWDKDENAWAIFYSFVHDGNFSAQHTISRQPGNNVPIFPGTGAFQHPNEVKAALKAMKTDKEVQKESPELVRRLALPFALWLITG